MTNGTKSEFTSHYRIAALRRRTSCCCCCCCCCSQPVSRMLATVLEWLTDFLTRAMMKSRKAARSKAVASPPEINSYNADSDKKPFSGRCRSRIMAYTAAHLYIIYHKLKWQCVPSWRLLRSVREAFFCPRSLSENQAWPQISYQKDSNGLT